MGTIIFNEYSALLALVVGMLVYGIRTAAEAAKPGLREAFWWDKIFLYFFPMIVGAGLAYVLTRMGTSLVPSALVSTGDRCLWGAVAGGSGGFAFKIYRNVANRAVDQSKTGQIPANLNVALSALAKSADPTSSPSTVPSTEPSSDKTKGSGEDATENRA